MFKSRRRRSPVPVAVGIEHYVSVPQIAERLSVDEGTVWRLIRSKLLKPVTKIGSATRIRTSAVQHFLEAHTK